MNTPMNTPNPQANASTSSGSGRGVDEELMFMVGLEKTKNSLRQVITQASSVYHLPSALIDSALEAVLAEQRQARLSLLTHTITIENPTPGQQGADHGKR